MDKRFVGDYEKNINFVQSDIERLHRDAFAVCSCTYFFTCNIGTADENGLRFAQLWANKTRGDTYAFKNARSNYIFMNCTMDEINVAFNLPGDRMDIALSDAINGLREKGNEKAASFTAEALVKLLGEENRKAVELFSRTITPLSVSEEWKIKRKRKQDRERVDSNGHVYGYSDQGSIQYPMVNNSLDDRDIIMETFLDKKEGNFRGFELFVPE